MVKSATVPTIHGMVDTLLMLRLLSHVTLGTLCLVQTQELVSHQDHGIKKLQLAPKVMTSANLYLTCQKFFYLIFCVNIVQHEKGTTELL